MNFTGQTSYEHGSTARIGVLLVNLGTPEAPTARGVTAVPAPIPRRPPRHRISRLAVETDPQRHHPQCTPEEIGQAVRLHLDRRRLAAAGLFAKRRRPDARRPAGNLGGCDPRRSGDAVRQSLHRRQAGSAAPGQRTAHPRPADVPAIFRHDHRHHLRHRVRRIKKMALDAGAAHDQQLSRPSAVH
jgi:hypothetical protein